jgi:hypothetical protein
MQSPMSRARKRYAGRDRSDDTAKRTRSCLRTAQRWLDQIDPVGAATLVFLQSIENYPNGLAREQANQSSLPSVVQLAAGLRSTGKHGPRSTKARRAA